MSVLQVKDTLVELNVLTPHCAEVYFEQLLFLDSTCGKLFIAKLLSLAVIAGAVVVKVPQIRNILKFGSKGLSSLSVFLEIVGFIVVIAHAIQAQFSVDAYAEAYFVFFQNVIIFILVVANSGSIQDIFQLIFLAMLFGESARRIYGFIKSEGQILILPTDQMELLRTSTILIFSASRVPQIFSNFTNKSTGSLSLITLLMQFFGSAARLFTTLADKKNYSPSVFWGFVTSVALLLILILQVFWYWSSPSPAESQKKKTKKVE